MLELEFSKPRFSLPEWRPQDLQFLQEQAHRLRHVSKSAGGASDALKKRATEILKAVASGHPLVQQVKSGKDIRALLMLWLHYNENGQLFAEKVPSSQALFKRFLAVRPCLSKLALHDLAQVYFNHFDRFPDLPLLCNYLQAQFAKQKFSGAQNLLANLSRHSKAVFNPNAPAAIVDLAIRQQRTLPDILSAYGVPETDGIFRERCTLLYYVSRLEQLKPGEESDLFAEVLQKKVVNAPYRDGLLIGHAVLNTLIGKVNQARVAMPENWMKIILTIAGDPRVPSSAASFQTWWRRLDQSYIDQVRGWLSRFDLDLFLRAFEAYANQNGDEDLRRMFPARKRFLEGLYEHGLIANTRLFIGTHAIEYLKQNYDAKELPVFAKLKHKDKSIIYMEVAGFHIIEGSHSAKFWVFDRLPARTNILNYNATTFSQSELGADLQRAYDWEARINPNLNGTRTGIVHHPNITWQHKVVNTLEKLGIRLDVEKLLTPEDYRKYKQKYGLAYY